MSSEPLDHSNEPEIDEVEAALSNLEVTLEGGHTDRMLVNKCFRQCYTGVDVSPNLKVFRCVTVEQLFLSRSDRWASDDCISLHGDVRRRHSIIDSCLSHPQEDITDIPELADSLRLFR